MVYKQIIDAVILKLVEGKYNKEANEIKEVSSAAYMSQSELLGEVSLHIIALIKDNKEMATLIAKELYDLKTYCLSIGLTIWQSGR